MKAGYILLAIFAFCKFDGQSQPLTKRQIYDEWVSSYSEINKDSFLLKVAEYDSLYRSTFLTTLRNLKKENIDTFGFIKIISAGKTKNAADSGSELYLFWEVEGKYYMKCFCKKVMQEFSIEDSKVIAFFKIHYDEIKKDYLLPPIYAATKNRDKIEYDSGLKFHEKRYTLFCQLGGKTKSYEFDESYINDERGLFYVDNISTFLFHLFLIAKAEIKKFKG